MTDPAESEIELVSGNPTPFGLIPESETKCVSLDMTLNSDTLVASAVV